MTDNRTSASVETLEARRFLSSTYGSISGAVFADANANGARDAKEAVVPKTYLFLDLNNNSVYDKKTEPVIKTDKNGAYSFTKLVAGTYRVREMSTQSAAVSAPASGWFRIALRSGQRLVNRNFGNAIIQQQTKSNTFLPGTVTTAAKASNIAAPSLAAVLGLAVSDNDAIFVGGTSFNSTDIIAKYTYSGDANLNGRVDGADYSRIDTSFGNELTSRGWMNGDFNYDGVVNGSDYAMIDNAFAAQGSILTGWFAAPT